MINKEANLWIIALGANSDVKPLIELVITGGGGMVKRLSDAVTSGRVESHTSSGHARRGGSLVSSLNSNLEFRK